MSYQVIARKWRPQTFEEVTGQELITQTLRNAIEHDRLHHAYLFSGARGVGKTTTARLLAKALNCKKTDGPNIHPCRTSGADACVSCIEIAESRSMDVLEIDAASNTGIDNVRDVIIDGINIIPARDDFKVFVIDEVHQLSKPAFNALLKTLEEPPPNVVFIMATTELHKVPDTIASRTQQFEFRTIPLQKIYDRLKLIAEAEKINASDEALREIARSGDGSMRDAQSNFDQVISFAADRIEVNDVASALGLASVDMLTRVLDAIVENKPAGMLSVVEELSTRGQDFRNFCRDLLGLFRDLLVARVGGDISLCEMSMLPAGELQERAAVFGESDLVRFFHSLAETETSLKEATQPRYLLEVGLVKLVEMRRLASIESILERLSNLEEPLADGKDANLKAAAAPESKPSDTFSEKKTLKVEPPLPEISSEVEGLPESRLQTEPVPASAIDLDFLKSIPVRLPPIPSEELEHIEDKWLDDAYERKLSWSGDDLAPIEGATAWTDLSEVGTQSQTSSMIVSNAHSSATAAAAMALAMSPDENEVPVVELPVLPQDATEKALMAYAQAHPAVRAALKVFRGKITGVKRLT
jgi:DNA polymerase-3 subunit gamma/tau